MQRQAPSEVGSLVALASEANVRIDDSKTFSEGGPPRPLDEGGEEDFKELGLDLSQSIDPGRPVGDGYAPLTEEQKSKLYEHARRWWWVWSRDARAPEVSRLVVLDVPTGDATPVAQKPYPIPYAYREAVEDELKKLLDAELQ